MRKIKVNYRTANILDWVFSVIFVALAFWADWRIGLAFLAYDLSCVFGDVRDEIKRKKAATEELAGKVKEYVDSLPNRGLPHEEIQGCQ